MLGKLKWLNIFLVVTGTYLYFSSAVPATLTARSYTDVKGVDESSVKLPDRLLHAKTLVLKKNQTFFSLLLELGIVAKDRAAILEAAKKVYDVRFLRPGVTVHAFVHESEPEDVVKMNFEITGTKSLFIFINEFSRWESLVTKKKITSVPVAFQGAVRSSLWESATEAGMDWDVISKFTDVFAWQIDFARELRTGARYRLVVDKLFAEGDFIGYGNILAAEFENAGELYRGVFHKSETQVGYFDLDGQSLKKLFLRSPVKFSRITSRFTKRRFHPVLKKYKAHNGVDYGAAPGTPVYATGDGVVRFAGWRGAAGRHVQIRHNSTYQTGYSHLKGFATGIRKGVRVRQGQVIGYVGSTGRVTGPHLHFVFYENGTFVDPLGKKFPAAEPLPKNAIPNFLAKAKGYLKQLPEWKTQDQM